MGEEIGNMFGPHNEDLFKDKDYVFEEPQKTFEEIYEEVFRYNTVFYVPTSLYFNGTNKLRRHNCAKNGKSLSLTVIY